MKLTCSLISALITPNPEGELPLEPGDKGMSMGRGEPNASALFSPPLGLFIFESALFVLRLKVPNSASTSSMLSRSFEEPDSNSNERR